VRTALATTHLEVTPGSPVLFDIEVTNTSDVIDGVTATITGLDPAWVQLVVPVVSLFPEATATLTLRLSLPDDCLAGEYLVTARVFSVVDPDRWSDHEFWLSVLPLHAASMKLKPSVIIGKRSARFDLLARNEGNVPLDLALSVTDPTRQARTAITPANLVVPAGETRSAEIDVSGKRPWFSQAVTRDFEVTATHPEVQLEARGTFTQRPRIARGVITFAILAAIIALWATIFLVVIDMLRDSAAPTKAVPEEFAEGGKDDVDLSAVGGTLSGIAASASGEGLPRITVEAFRLDRDGAPQSIGSTATGDDGSYEFEALLPGSYHLRFTADGFDELWYPAAPDETGAADVALEPGGEVEDLAVVLVGKPGTMSGEIVTPESTAPTSTTIELRQVIEDPVEGQPAPEPIGPFPVSNGVFQVPELPTPATYHIIIRSTGFEAAEFDETLAAGQTKVLNTVTLSAARGGIQGTVTDGDGTPLGNVTVTVSSGEFVTTVTTPTAGSIGAFLVDGLETPQTYVVSFSLAGYEGQTVAVDLAPGATLTLNGRLIGGTGEASGTVVGRDGTPIGGAKLVVAGGDFTAESASLTGDDATTSGAWSVAGLPVPGAYTVTVSADGYLDETLSVVLDGTAPAEGIVVTLTRATASIQGTVANGGAGVGDVTVTLSNGDDPRVTSTATTPPGAYQFGDVTPGTYTLTFSRSGLATRVVVVTVAPGDELVRDIELPTVG